MEQRTVADDDAVQTFWRLASFDENLSVAKDEAGTEGPFVEAALRLAPYEFCVGISSHGWIATNRGVWSNGRWLRTTGCLGIEGSGDVEFLGMDHGGLAAARIHDGATEPRQVLLFPVEITSRDRFVACSLRVPEGWEQLEVELVNTTTGENTGRWGNLLSNGGNGTGGNPRIYQKFEDVLDEDDVDETDGSSGLQSPEQKVWFIRDAEDPRRLDFYTCFNGTGTVELRLHLPWLDGEEGGTVGTGTPPLRQTPRVVHELQPEPRFASWINALDRMARLDGLATTLPEAILAPGAPEPDIFLAAPGSDSLHYLTGALCIPVFNCIATFDTVEALARGMLQGMWQGLKDDALFYGVIAGAAVAVPLGADVATSPDYRAALDRWLISRGTSSQQVMELLKKVVQCCILDPLRSHAAAVAADLTTWEGIKKRAWRTMQFAAAPGAAGTASFLFAHRTEILDGLLDWLTDFAERSMDQAERNAWKLTPWDRDGLLGQIQLQRYTVFHGIGFGTGYVAEQVAVGVLATMVTGGGTGVAKLGQYLVKGGEIILPKLLRRGAFCVVARMTWTKLLSREAAAAFTPALKEAVELGLREIVTKEVNAEVKHCAADIVEDMMRRQGFERTVCTIRDIVEAIATKPMIKRLALEVPGGASAYFRNVALMLHLLDDQAEGVALKSFIDLIDQKLIRQGADGKAFDWMEDFLRSCRGSAPEMASRPPLKEYRSWDKDVLRSLLQDLDIWKSPPIGPTTRGVIAETDLAHSIYKGWGWTPNGAAVDFFKDGVAVQLKTIDNVHGISALQDAISALSRFGDGATSQRVFDVRHKPGLDVRNLKAQLDEFMRLNADDPDWLPNPVTIVFTEYAL